MATPGSHLLGRKPNTIDTRDYSVSDLRRSLDRPFFLPDEPVLWGNQMPALDQGETPHCGGFGGVQWCNVAPVLNELIEADGHALYYEVKVIEGEPGAENGVMSRDVAQALRQRGRLEAFGFATTVDEVRDWVRTQGPVMVGTDWTNSMFFPDENGYIKVEGESEGGHFWVIVGDIPDEEAFIALNSWGTEWGQEGYFKIKWADFARLLVGLDQWSGDAIVSSELPLAEVEPDPDDEWVEPEPEVPIPEVPTVYKPVDWGALLRRLLDWLRRVFVGR